MKRDDPTIMLIFDDAGYIAGIQISFFKKLANEQFYPFSTADPYQVLKHFLEVPRSTKNNFCSLTNISHTKTGT
jgi:hypothetical protein